jgi:hypothetical protein
MTANELATYVYILSDYGEHGAEHVRATCDRSKVVELFSTVVFPEACPAKPVELNEEAWNAYLQRRSKARIENIAELTRVLDSTQGEIAEFGHDLSKSWGGIQLHIVKLW